MTAPCARTINFIIPGRGNSPSVSVTVVEANGSLLFSAEVLGGPSRIGGDLRGLFFDFNDDAKLDGLSFIGADVTGSSTGNVIDLGHGANLHGKAQSFDAGVEFGTPGIGKDDIQSTSFALTNPSGNLTLDDIANVEFGARLTSVGAKLVTTAPAAPLAGDDAYYIYEDGQAGLDAPSHTPVGTIFQVLDNDTDADGDTLTIINVDGAEHGTIEIVDGDDADSLSGDAILYTPFEDYSGIDSFWYCISDNNGGVDSATVDVDITAVADIPDLTYEIIAGETVNTFTIRVTATQTDTDSSEFIDRIALSNIPEGILVDSQIYNPSDEFAQIVHDFTFTLPMDQDTSFDLGITAFSQEISNGDEESNIVTVPISFEYNDNEYDLTFAANDQSIWSEGPEAIFTDDRFIGIDTSWNESGSAGFLYGSSSGNFKAGFQSTLELTAGGIDASVPYDIEVETNYNKTTDALQISSSAIIDEGGYFLTEGPGGSYNLDFIYDILINAEAGLDLWDQYSLVNVSLGPYEGGIDIIDFDSSDLSYETPSYFGLSLTFAWPDLDTNSDSSATNVFTSSGESNNFLQLTLDVDDFIFDVASLIAGFDIPNPFAEYSLDLGVVWGSIELLDMDLWAGLNFAQDYTMTVNGLPGVITYEDGTESNFTFGEDLVVTDASQHDQNMDGQIDFSVALDPDVMLNNDTDLGLNLGYLFKVLEASGGYDVWLDSDSFSWTAYSTSDDTTIPIIGVYDETFALDFGALDINFSA